MKMKRRKKDFIDPEVQGAIARRLVLHWFVFLVVACCLSVAVKWMLNPFEYASAYELLVAGWYAYSPVLLVLVCLAPVFIFDAVRLSNRFSGPVYRLRMATRQLAEGEVPENIEFRGADFWKDLAADFNRIAYRIRKSEAESSPTAEEVS